MGLVVPAAATGLLHISVAALLGGLLMAVTGCVPVRGIYRRVEWRVIFLIACMSPLAASTTFLTPIGHQANVLVYGSGNYRFADFPRAGAILNVLIFLVSMVVIPIVWPFEPAVP